MIAFQGTDSIKDAVTGLHHTWDMIDRQYICAELFAKQVYDNIVTGQVCRTKIHMSNLVSMQDMIYVK